MVVPGRGLWPVRCAPVGLVAVGSVLWRYDGALYCTAIVKGTFHLPESGLVERINPTPIARTDDYLHGLPSLAVGGETAPRRTRADVTVVGHAYADKGPTTKRSVRLMVVRGKQILIDKTLYIYCDRDSQGGLIPFDKIRIGYERALGGLDHPDNPIGVGLDEGSSRQPNVVDPRAPDRRVAGYGPIPARFPERRKQRGKVPLELIENGIVDYPRGFDWEYFQAAPLDQRIPVLKGDEWLMLEGLHPRHERVRARLPRARALCTIYARQNVGAPETVDLTPDQLHIEPDHERCSVVWRGRFPIASELAADQLVIAGAIQEGDQNVTWPADLDELEFAASPAPASTDVPGRLDDDLQATAFAPRVPQAPRRSLGLGYRLGEQRLPLDAAAPQHAAQATDDVPPAMPPSEVPPAPPSYAGVGPWAPPAAPGVPADLADGHGASAAQREATASTPANSASSPLFATDEMANPEQEAARDAGLEFGDSTEVVDLEDGDIELVDTNK